LTFLNPSPPDKSVAVTREYVFHARFHDTPYIITSPFIACLSPGMSFFPIKFFMRTISKLFKEDSQKVVPTPLMPPVQVMVRKPGMHQGHERVFSLFHKGQSHHRLLSQGIG